MPPAEDKPSDGSGLTDAHVVSTLLLRTCGPPEPDDGGDKHSRGTVAVVGGATSTPGAVLLAALAALRAGAGRLQVLTVDTTSVAVGVALSEAMVRGLPADAGGSLSPDAADERADALAGAGTIVLGPGLADTGRAELLLERLLPRLDDDATVVLDAVALTGLAGRPELLRPLSGRVVLTPNSGETAALLEGAELDGCEAAHAVAERYDAVVSARGWVVCPDGRTWRLEAGASAWGPPAPAMSSPDSSAACWPAAATPRRPRCGASTCTPRPVTGLPPGSAGWASWPANCSTRCPRCSPPCVPEPAPARTTLRRSSLVRAGAAG